MKWVAVFLLAASFSAVQSSRKHKSHKNEADNYLSVTVSYETSDTITRPYRKYLSSEQIRQQKQISIPKSTTKTPENEVKGNVLDYFPQENGEKISKEDAVENSKSVLIPPPVNQKMKTMGYFPAIIEEKTESNEYPQMNRKTSKELLSQVKPSLKQFLPASPYDINKLSTTYGLPTANYNKNSDSQPVKNVNNQRAKQENVDVRNVEYKRNLERNRNPTDQKYFSNQLTFTNNQPHDEHFYSSYGTDSKHSPNEYVNSNKKSDKYKVTNMGNTKPSSDYMPPKYDPKINSNQYQSPTDIINQYYSKQVANSFSPANVNSKQLPNVHPSQKNNDHQFNQKSATIGPKKPSVVLLPPFYNPTFTFNQLKATTKVNNQNQKSVPDANTSESKVSNNYHAPSNVDQVKAQMLPKQQKPLNGYDNSFVPKQISDKNVRQNFDAKQSINEQQYSIRPLIEQYSNSAFVHQKHSNNNQAPYIANDNQFVPLTNNKQVNQNQNAMNSNRNSYNEPMQPNRLPLSKNENQKQQSNAFEQRVQPTEFVQKIFNNTFKPSALDSTSLIQNFNDQQKNTLFIPQTFQDTNVKLNFNNVTFNAATKNILPKTTNHNIQYNDMEASNSDYQRNRYSNFQDTKQSVGSNNSPMQLKNSSNQNENQNNFSPVIEPQYKNKQFTPSVIPQQYNDPYFNPQQNMPLVESPQNFYQSFLETNVDKNVFSPMNKTDVFVPSVVQNSNPTYQAVANTEMKQNSSLPVSNVVTMNGNPNQQDLFKNHNMNSQNLNMYSSLNNAFGGSQVMQSDQQQLLAPQYLLPKEGFLFNQHPNATYQDQTASRRYDVPQHMFPFQNNDYPYSTPPFTYMYAQADDISNGETKKNGVDTAYSTANSNQYNVPKEIEIGKNSNLNKWSRSEPITTPANNQPTLYGTKLTLPSMSYDQNRSPSHQNAVITELKKVESSPSEPAKYELQTINMFKATQPHDVYANQYNGQYAPLQQQLSFTNTYNHPAEPYIPGPTTEPIPILRQSNEIGVDGSFSYETLTGDQTHVIQQGHIENPGTEHEQQVIRGSYSYLGADGITYTVNYIADSNGFRASGEHLPTPPPIPELIQRSIDYNIAEEAARASLPPQIQEYPYPQVSNNIASSIPNVQQSYVNPNQLTGDNKSPDVIRERSFRNNGYTQYLI